MRFLIVADLTGFPPGAGHPIAIHGRLAGAGR